MPWHEQYQTSEKLLQSSWGGGWARVAVHMHFAPGGKLDPDRTQVELNQKTNLNHIGREVLSLFPPCISQIWHHCWWNAITTCGKINYFVILQSKMQIFRRKHTNQQHSSLCTSSTNLSCLDHAWKSIQLLLHTCIVKWLVPSRLSKTGSSIFENTYWSVLKKR